LKGSKLAKIKFEIFMGIKNLFNLYFEVVALCCTSFWKEKKVWTYVLKQMVPSSQFPINWTKQTLIIKLLYYVFITSLILFFLESFLAPNVETLRFYLSCLILGQVWPCVFATYHGKNLVSYIISCLIVPKKLHILVENT
jgi:hypothetical protein